ncbi:MAG: PDDEXK nuclease domain-containing protein [Chitinophagaceae bacterium]|nr:PDDEXK nuclease domain-containing protein [Chitinophagaceae bacterium]
MDLFSNNKEYKNWITNLKAVIKQRQLKAAVAVNSQLILLYWELGKQITEKQELSKWGSGFIEQLSKDLKAAFPDMGGFSRTNLFAVKKFYQFYASFQFVPRPGGQIDALVIPRPGGQTNLPEIIKFCSQIPWKHNVFIIEKVKDREEVLFYVQQTILNNWSRSVLEYQIESGLYKRQGKAVTNFENTLPKEDSDLAIELLKDPYNFEFLSLSATVKELELEKKLVQHITEFLLELGRGFAYLGRQYVLKAGNREFKTDLLFYHIHLKRFIIIDLKMNEFEPEHAGKMNFYINAINETIKGKEDKPAIGILLCKNKDNVVVDFSLKDIANPIGISSFTYMELPSEIQTELPTPEEWDNELKKAENE